jgi:hypothetical protein
VEESSIEMPSKHVVVDGSNIATEGRTAPSLTQLDEAVRAFIAHADVDHVTVVVDATFPNRIDKKERAHYEDAVNAGEIITPPAGAIGRGDAFILEIADRAGACILSNDSFQEFHGKYEWLFSPGRLIGGKPVPHVGWVFMERMPVRGATSRKAVSAARKRSGAAETTKKRARASAAASAPMPVPTAPPPRAKAKKARAERAAPPAKAKPSKATKAGKTAKATVEGAALSTSEARTTRRRRSRGRGEGAAPEPYNEPLPFLEFVAAHPLGSLVDGTVERFASHGAYITLEGVSAYIPLRNMADPPPRSARSVMRVGDTRQFVVQAVDAPRRGVDLAIPDVAPAPEPLALVGAAAHPEPNKEEERVAPVKKAAKRSAKRTTAKKTARKAAKRKTTARRAPARKTAARKTAKKRAPARKAAKKATKKRAPARKAAKKATKKATKKRAGARKSTAKKATKKATKKRATARKTGARKAAKKRAPARKSARKRS